jgi:hypothetical protein
MKHIKKRRKEQLKIQPALDRTALKRSHWLIKVITHLQPITEDINSRNKDQQLSIMNRVVTPPQYRTDKGLEDTYYAILTKRLHDLTKKA